MPRRRPPWIDGENAAVEVLGFMTGPPELDWQVGEYHAWLSRESMVAKSPRTSLPESRSASPMRMCPGFQAR